MPRTSRWPPGGDLRGEPCVYGEACRDREDTKGEQRRAYDALEAAMEEALAAWRQKAIRLAAADACPGAFKEEAEAYVAGLRRSSRVNRPLMEEYIQVLELDVSKAKHKFTQAISAFNQTDAMTPCRSPMCRQRQECPLYPPPNFWEDFWVSRLGRGTGLSHGLIDTLTFLSST